MSVDHKDDLHLRWARAEVLRLRVAVDALQGRIDALVAERLTLCEAMAEVLRISDRRHDAWDRARALIAAAPPSAACSNVDPGQEQIK